MSLRAALASICCSFAGVASTRCRLVRGDVGPGEAARAGAGSRSGEMV